MTAAERPGSTTAPPTVRPCGDAAVLLEVTAPDEAGALDEVRALHATLRAHRPDGVVDLVPAARTVLVVFDPLVTTAGRVTDAVATLPRAATAPADLPLVEIPVVYDGDDLADIARRTGLSSDDVVARHLAARYTVAFIGFAPGFAYLSGLDPALTVPRRETPRTRVPAGAVAVAERFCGIYPRPAPGGWNLLGRTDAVLWDPARTPPALLPPGTPVRFVDRTREWSS
ncbi:5-oxoprolinase subunit B family protein [Jiangella gansuensis]|uniref:5-oxoprolinase subunit B family protein n=1 Tax=Jiangella gansuensis TaxID=281473 RepID=UPI0004B46740|nr:allophanate hydrolase subunit 1 [Jiangella gansuensis]